MLRDPGLFFEDPHSRFGIQPLELVGRRQADNASANDRQVLRSAQILIPSLIIQFVKPLVVAGLHPAHPFLIAAIPVDCRGQPHFKRHPGSPPRRMHQLFARQRVTTVMSGPVRHVLDQRLVLSGCRQNPLHDVNIGQRAYSQLAEEANQEDFLWHEVRPGDEVRFGHAVLRVVVTPVEMPPDEPIFHFPSSVLWL